MMAATLASTATASALAEVDAALDRQGWATLAGLLAPAECEALTRLYDSGKFRSRVIMKRHGFGEGEYQYFDYPLPDVVASLRRDLYRTLAPIANDWAARLGRAGSFPAELDDFTALCRAAGQTRATPLLLKYGLGDYNRLHQDLYGDIFFPFQVVVLLSRPGRDFEGGEFVLVEQKPRSQSRATVVPLGCGDAAVFAVDHRPARGVNGYYKAALRHGVSTVREGRRFTLGVIFHEAR